MGDLIPGISGYQRGPYGGRVARGLLAPSPASGYFTPRSSFPMVASWPEPPSPWGQVPSTQPWTPWWLRQSTPRLFYPDPIRNNFPVWSSPPPGGGIIPPPGGTTPPPGGTIPPPGSMTSPPGGWYPEPGPSTGPGGDTGGDGGPTGPPGDSVSIGDVAAPGDTGTGVSGSVSPSSGGGFSISIPGTGMSVSPTVGLNSGLVGTIGQAFGLPGSFLGDIAVSVLGGPLAGIANSVLGQALQAAQAQFAFRSLISNPPRSGTAGGSPAVGLTPADIDLAIQAEHGETGDVGVTGLTPADVDVAVTAEQGETGAGTTGDTGGTPGVDGAPAGPYHRGGMIPNRGRRALETVPIIAKEGEFVMRPEVTRRFAPILELINASPNLSIEQLMQLIAGAQTADQYRGRV